ncbi:class I SAM-dependent methyltransferase [Sediminicoccus rosea]|jgi:SAM-dependent methyltransferase|uniref:Class I SAM-dependent methyltransferase n=1 Tax=Sediminicoccus rosea TaxID=1225128 RepID=A0ABZ0PGH2_9PROT|nr:class I SAM-dependent methyltransferase [Sediminicoccus rosea]WPB84736.1 class I SAM-dependent methyltransferase [Sediminicoccus rosea]
MFVRQKRSIRETYPCQSCRSTLRYRVQAEAILNHYSSLAAPDLTSLVKMPGFRNLVIFEPGISGPFRAIFKGLPHYTKSFYWSDLASGAMRDGVTNQDLMALSLADASVDLVITSDIFEHVRHPYRAFAEISRVLKPGGAHIFTIPTASPLAPKTVKRVDVDGDEDVFLLPEVYHGDGKGGRSLVYNDFGMDMLDELEKLATTTTIFSYPYNERPVRSALAFVSVKKHS